MNNIRLQWNSRDTSNIEKVTIYRSSSPNVDLTASNEIATLGGHVESFEDEDIPNGTTFYYVIEQVRHNGESIICEPIKIESNKGIVPTSIGKPMLTEVEGTLSPTIEGDTVDGIGNHLSSDWYIYGDREEHSIKDSTNLTQYTIDMGEGIFVGVADIKARVRYKGSLYETTWSDPVTLNVSVGVISNGLVFVDGEESRYFRQISEPTSPEAILNTWPRSLTDSFWKNPNDATGQAGDWYYDGTLGSFVQPNNSSNYLQILSPDTSTNYIVEATLSSVSSDNDSIGLVLASDYIDGELLSVAAVVEPGGGFIRDVTDGSLRSNTLKLAFFDSSTNHTNDTNIIGYNSVVPNKGNWSSLGNIRMRIQRDDTMLSVKISNWNDVGNYNDATEITYDMNDLPRNGYKLLEGSRFGFNTISQAESTYFDIRIQSDSYTDDNVTYSANPDERWEYRGGAWIQDGIIYDDFNESDIIFNPRTKEYFRKNGTSFEFAYTEGITGDIPTLYLSQTGTTYSSEQVADLYNYEHGTTPLQVVEILETFNCDVSKNGDNIEIDLLGNSSGSFFATIQSPDETIGFKEFKVRL